MTDERTPNVPLLRKVVEWVEEQEQVTEGREWYQPQYAARGVDVGRGLKTTAHFCDTAYCVAGKIVIDHGWTPAWEEDYWLTATCERDGRTQEIDDVAQELLGISDDDAISLFTGGNTAADIRQIAESIAGERL